MTNNSGLTLRIGMLEVYAQANLRERERERERVRYTTCTHKYGHATCVRAQYLIVPHFSDKDMLLCK